MGNYAERASEIVRAVHLLRQHGVNVGFPMQTASGEVIFAVGKDFTLTPEQLLELLERGELHPEGIRKLVAAQAVATPLRKNATSSWGRGRAAHPHTDRIVPVKRGCRWHSASSSPLPAWRKQSRVPPTASHRSAQTQILQRKQLQRLGVRARCRAR